MKARLLLWIGLALCLVVATSRGADAQDASKPGTRTPTIDYNRSIRPILSNNCFKCHGPDAAERKSELRLDVRDAATKPAETGAVAIVPGNVEESELVLRIFAPESDVVMPPPASN